MLDPNNLNLKDGVRDLFEEGSIKFNEVKNHIITLLPFWIAGSITAAVASLYANLFAQAEILSRYIFEQTGYWYLGVVPIVFFLSWFFVEKWSPYASGSGIPQLMAATELTHLKKEGSAIEILLGIKVIIIKVISSLVAVIGGGAIGREGPTLQISCSIFYLFNKSWSHLNDVKSRYSFLLAGAASGLAAAFNTPLGGIVYVVEELAKSHLSSFRTGVIHSVIFAGLISQLFMGSYLYFGYPKTGVFNYSYIGLVIFLAIISGAVVALFAQALKAIVRYRDRLEGFKSRAIFALISGLLFAAIAIWVSPNSIGPGKELINKLLFDNIASDIWSVVGRFFGTVLTYSTGGAGGIFAPTLSLGGAASSFTNSFFGNEIGTLATLIGMTSGLAALTHSPLTSFILILEMTDRHSAIFPLMIAAAIGHGVSKLISRKSFYEFVFDRIFLNFTKQERHENRS